MAVRELTPDYRLRINLVDTTSLLLLKIFDRIITPGLAAYLIRNEQFPNCQVLKDLSVVLETC